MERNLGSVQNKISCVFETAVIDEHSSKRAYQPYKVVAMDTIKQKAIDDGIHTATATEKLDGTCVYISMFEGRPWLWARFDRKPSKVAEKCFRKFQQQHKLRQGHKVCSGDNSTFKWDFTKDFKETPEDWIPASNVPLMDGLPVPDDIGHTPGWVPVSVSSRSHLWHLSAVDLTHSLALVLKEYNDSECLYIDCVRLSELNGSTAELIGTNINGNPYGLGSKQYPIHLLVMHGSIKIRNPPAIHIDAIRKWFMNDGQLEGIVWHCSNSTLYKVHRNHVSLQWPVLEPTLTLRPVKIIADISRYELDDNKCLLVQFAKLNGQACDSLKDLEMLMVNGTVSCSHNRNVTTDNTFT